MSISRVSVSIFLVAKLLASTTLAVNIETVLVGDAGNVGELSGSGAGGFGNTRLCGAVAYDYRIATHEVTAAAYTEFLNKVAATDTYELYDERMWSSPYGCKIDRAGSSGSYTYSVASDYANRPVNYVSYWDSCRFANWLHNGQPTGAQGAGTTERGAYQLDGVNSNAVGPSSRSAGWRWAVPSEDEWYKAAYYKGGSTNAGYWDYPTSSNAIPGRDMADLYGNNANYYSGSGPYPIDADKYTTIAGEFQNSGSPYGTFDQGGNVFEWTQFHVMRGGSFLNSSNNMHAFGRIDHYGPTHADYVLGFRVMEVPEPAALTFLALGGLAVPARKRRP